MDRYTGDGGLPSPLTAKLVALVALTLSAVATALFAPEFGEAAVAVVAVATLVLGESLAGSQTVHGLSSLRRKVVAIVLAESGLATALLGIRLLRPGAGRWSLIASGGLIGGLVLMGALRLASAVNGRPIVGAFTLGALLVGAVGAGALALEYLPGGMQASAPTTLAGAGFIGVFLVGVFYDALRTA